MWSSRAVCKVPCSYLPYSLNQMPLSISCRTSGCAEWNSHRSQILAAANIPVAVTIEPDPTHPLAIYSSPMIEGRQIRGLVHKTKESWQCLFGLTAWCLQPLHLPWGSRFLHLLSCLCSRKFHTHGRISGWFPLEALLHPLDASKPSHCIYILCWFYKTGFSQNPYIYKQKILPIPLSVINTVLE